MSDAFIFNISDSDRREPAKIVMPTYPQGVPVTHAVSQTPEDGAADEDGLGAERESLEHVRATADASIKVHLAASTHSRHYLQTQRDTLHVKQCFHQFTSL